MNNIKHQKFRWSKVLVPTMILLKMNDQHQNIKNFVDDKKISKIKIMISTPNIDKIFCTNDNIDIEIENWKYHWMIKHWNYDINSKYWKFLWMITYYQHQNFIVNKNMKFLSLLHQLFHDSKVDTQQFS